MTTYALESELRARNEYLSHRVTELETTEHVLRAIFERALDGIIVADADGRCLDANPAACRLFGLSKEALVGERFADLAAAGQPRPESRLSPFPPSGEIVLQSEGGDERIVDYSAMSHREPGAHIVLLRDVTEQVAAGRAQREAEQRLRTVINNAPIILFAVGPDGRYLMHEGSGLASVGLRPGETVGQSMLQRMRFRGDAEDAFRRAMSGDRVNGEFEAGGKTFDCTVVPMRRDRDGAITGVTGVAVDVSARKAAEEALRGREARFRAMIEKSEDGIALLDAEGRPLYQSPATEKILGYAFDEARTMRWTDFLDEGEAARLAGVWEAIVAAPSKTHTIELRIRRKDGERRWVEVSARSLLGDSDVGAVVMNVRDVTSRRALERERDGFFQLAVNPMGVLATDGHIKRVNAAWQRTLGWTPEEVTGRAWVELVHPEDAAAAARGWARLEVEGATTFEVRYRAADGGHRRIQWSAMASASDGLVFVTGRDVTDERAAAERDRLLFTKSPVPMFVIDSATRRFVDVNESALEMYGYARDEFLALAVDDVVVPEQHEDLRETLRRAEGQPTIAVQNRRHRTKSGVVLDVEVTATRREAGGPPSMLSVIRNVTSAKRMAADLRVIDERYRRIVENASEGIWMYDATGHIVFVNPRMCEMLGRTSDEILGRSVLDFMHPSEHGRARDAVERRKQGKRDGRAEYRLLRKDGTDLWVSAVSDALRDRDGRFESGLVLLTDVTEQRRAAEALRHSEEQLRQSQKMEAIGRLAGGVAHDFNNVLSVILSYTQILVADLPPHDPIREDLEEMRRAGERAAELTRQLLAFGRKQILQPRVVDANELVRGMVKMLKRLLGEDVELVIDASASPAHVHVDPGQLEQVIMNLVVNARDAMPNGGTLRIESGVAPEGADDDGSARCATITVVDSGIGMDAATLKRIFEPFFTTKPAGKGTGLGLSTAYGIVQQSGGQIVVESEPGRGTTFRVQLPICEPTKKQGRPASMRPALRRGSETILLVEDDVQVRGVVATILRKRGYFVLEADGGGDALLTSEQVHGEIDLLLTDVVMPRMDGRQLAERLGQQRPHMKVLFMSGYSEDTTAFHGVLDPGIELLTKPITPEALLRKIREVLDR